MVKGAIVLADQRRGHRLQGVVRPFLAHWHLGRTKTRKGGVRFSPNPAGNAESFNNDCHRWLRCIRDDHGRASSFEPFGSHPH
jgi:hypothetical protein